LSVVCVRVKATLLLFIGWGGGVKCKSAPNRPPPGHPGALHPELPPEPTFGGVNAPPHVGRAHLAAPLARVRPGRERARPGEPGPGLRPGASLLGLESGPGGCSARS